MKYKKLVIAFVVGLLSTIIVISCSGDGDNEIVSGGSDDNTISGTYKRVLFSYSNGVPLSSFADMTFDGNGNISVDNVFSTPYGANQTGSGSGTYSVNPDGTFTFHFGDAEVVGLLHEDGRSYIATRVDSNNTQAITVGIKAGNSGYTNASFNGVYKRVLFAYGNGVSRSSFADMTFDGNGNISMDNVFSTPYGANQTGSGSGTYSVNPDGTFTFHFGDVEVVGLLHEDGKSYIAARVDSNATQAIIIGTKK